MRSLPPTAVSPSSVTDAFMMVPSVDVLSIARMPNPLAAVETFIPRLLSCLVLGFFAVGYLAFQLVHDPLRKFPGPFVAKLTSGYGAFYVWRRCLHLMTHNLHEKYGPIVRLAPKRLVFNNPAAMQDIYNNPRTTKGQAYVQLRREPNGPPTIFTSLNKAEHRAKRRLVSPILNENSMRTFEAQLSRQVDSFLLELLRSSRQREVVNVSERCERLAFDIMGQLAFSYHMNTQGDAAHRGLVEGIKSRVNRNTVYFFFPGLRVVDFLFNVAGALGVDRFSKSLRTIFEARMRLPKNANRDFYALASEQMGLGLASTELWGEAIFFLAAGGATTATATSGILFYLSRNPEAYARLASEIRTTFTSGADIHPGPQLNSCAYLRAVVEESMRMSPPVLEYMWRQQDPASVAAGEQFIVQGHVIPPGTQVAASQYSIQHDEMLFPEPYKFQPERWLSPKNGSRAESGEQREALMARRRAFAPFSIGERACAGRSMAWLEMRLTVARTLWYFDFARAAGEAGELGAGWEGRTDGRGRVDEFQLYHSIVVEHTGPNLVFTPRDDCCKDLEEHAKA